MCVCDLYFKLAYFAGSVFSGLHNWAGNSPAHGVLLAGLPSVAAGLPKRSQFPVFYVGKMGVPNSLAGVVEWGSEFNTLKEAAGNRLFPAAQRGD
jgi:hypothetical protein